MGVIVPVHAAAHQEVKTAKRTKRSKTTWNLEGPAHPLKQVPPLIAGRTWATWADTPADADVPVPTPLQKKYCLDARSLKRMKGDEYAIQLARLKKEAEEATTRLLEFITGHVKRKMSGWERTRLKKMKFTQMEMEMAAEEEARGLDLTA